MKDTTSAPVEMEAFFDAYARINDAIRALDGAIAQIRRAEYVSPNTDGRRGMHDLIPRLRDERDTLTRYLPKLVAIASCYYTQDGGQT